MTPTELAETTTAHSGGAEPRSAAPSDEFLLPALAIGRQIADEAVVDSEGCLTWGRGAGGQQQPVPDSGPFNGRVGEALLFAALHDAAGEEEWREKALRTVGRLLRLSRDAAERETLMRETSLGLSGVGGITYCLLLVGQLTGSDEVLDAAARIGRLLDVDEVRKDYRHDLIWGNAGAVLALLALGDAGEDWVWEPARAAAEELLGARSVDEESGKRAWRTLKATPSTGFAHGAGGIAHALLELHRRQPDDRFYEAAVEAFDFERAYYREDFDNWDDSAVERDTAGRMWSWCHGAPGIALARLSILGLVTPEHEGAVAHDLRTALQATMKARIPGVDTICCGTFGRLDVVHQAGLSLGNPSLLLNAEQLARQRLHRASVKGSFLLNDVDDSVEPHLYPGLWQGFGGSAFTLLRLARPGRLPSILSMEPLPSSRMAGLRSPAPETAGSDPAGAGTEG